MFPNISDLKRLRQRAGLSQTELARSVGISQSAIAKYESGSQTPSYEKATKILGYLLEAEPINEPDLGELMQEDIIFLDNNDKLNRAIKIMKNNSISQLPVQNSSGMIVGTISESGLVDIMTQFHDLNQFKREKVVAIMEEPMPIVPSIAKASDISSLLKRFGGVLVSKKGRVVGIVTKADLIYQ